MIMAADSELFMSAASWWELAIKSSLGRLTFDPSAARKAFELRGVTGLPITIAHAEAAAALPKMHGDPFDHMLVAQSATEELTLLTRDRELAAYGPTVLCV
jgi:PIN domain nuclease of toxin-antitoxin system